MDCLFCKLVAGEIPSQKLYEDDLCLAFQDISPQAPSHFLVIPKRHLVSLAEVQPGDEELLGHLMMVISKVAREVGLDQAGYRVVTNIGEDGQQTVKHLHYHVLGGRSLTWPPG